MTSRESSGFAVFSGLRGKSRQFLQVLWPELEASLGKDAFIFRDLSKQLGTREFQFAESYNYLRAFDFYRQEKFSFSLNLIEDCVESPVSKLALSYFPGLPIYFDTVRSAIYEGKLLPREEEVEEQGDEEREMTELEHLNLREWSIDVFDGLLTGLSSYAYASPSGPQSGPAFFLSESQRRWAAAKLGSGDAELNKIFFPLRLGGQVSREAASKELVEKLRIAGVSLDSDLPIVAWTGERVFEDRLHSGLEALQAISGKANGLVLVSEELLERLPKYGIKLEDSSCHFISYNGDSELEKLVKACDVVLAPRQDIQRGQSLGFYFALEANIPVITLSIGEAADYPDECLLKVRPGRYETRELVCCLNALLNSRELVAKLKSNLKRFSESYCSPAHVAGEIQSGVAASKAVISSRLAERDAQVLSHIQIAKAKLDDFKLPR